mgnify:CR=1 FL=1
MKEKTSQRLNKATLIANLREIADKIEKDSLQIGGKIIVLPESAVFTLEWEEKISKRKLEIEIEW